MCNYKKPLKACVIRFLMHALYYSGIRSTGPINSIITNFYEMKLILFLFSYVMFKFSFHATAKGPSIYDVHTVGEGVRLRWMHVDSGGGPAPYLRPHRKLKLESTDVILSFSHAKKLVYFFTRISSLDGIKSGNFSAI